MICNIISSGSNGNAVIYDKRIMVDCGVSLKALQEVKKELQIVLLTHKHKDHLNLKTLQKLQSERPTLRIGCGNFLLEELPNLKNIDVFEIGKVYNYGAFKISPIKLFHDVPNIGYRIFINDKKILHATDTAHLEGIIAKGYDVYAIEHNYDEMKLQQAQEESYQKVEFTHAFGSEQTHLSWQQARAFIEANKNETSKIIELHKSKSFY